MKQQLLVPFKGDVLTYITKVLAIEAANLIAAWPGDDASGSQCTELINGWHGTYTGVTLNASTGPDGQPVGLYDGINDGTEVYTTSFRDAFDGNLGSVVTWAKVSGVGVWSDGVNRAALQIRAHFNDQIKFARQGVVANRLVLEGRWGAAHCARSMDGMSETGWMCLGATWDTVGAEVKFYYQGVQEGATITTPNTWTNALVDNWSCVGCRSVAPAESWSGWMGPTFVWTAVLDDDHMLEVATV